MLELENLKSLDVSNEVLRKGEELLRREQQLRVEFDITMKALDETKDEKGTVEYTKAQEQKRLYNRRFREFEAERSKLAAVYAY